VFEGDTSVCWHAVIAIVQVSLDNYTEWMQLVAHALIQKRGPTKIRIYHLLFPCGSCCCAGAGGQLYDVGSSVGTTYDLPRQFSPCLSCLLTPSHFAHVLQVSVDNYTEWIQLVAQLTIDSLNSSSL
jgi:hypothetical protein